MFIISDSQFQEIMKFHSFHPARPLKSALENTQQLQTRWAKRQLLLQNQSLPNIWKLWSRAQQLTQGIQDYGNTQQASGPDSCRCTWAFQHKLLPSFWSSSHDHCVTPTTFDHVTLPLPQEGTLKSTLAPAQVMAIDVEWSNGPLRCHRSDPPECNSWPKHLARSSWKIFGSALQSGHHRNRDRNHPCRRRNLWSHAVPHLKTLPRLRTYHSSSRQEALAM